MSNSDNLLSQFFGVLKLIILLSILFMIFVVVRGGILEQQHLNERDTININFYKRFNEYFKGVVVKIKRMEPEEKGGVRDACLKIRLIESTRCYLQKKKGEAHFCVIDFPYAEVMTKDYGDIKIGDSCFYNGHADCFGIKVGNERWYMNQPEISDYDLLSSSNSSIPKYSRSQLEKRKITYPPAEIPTIEQISFYLQHKCKNVVEGYLPMDYNLKFYRYSTWLVTKNAPSTIKKKEEQSYFYMLQIAEYKEPLMLDSLQTKFDEEPVIWIEQDGVHKYFINRKINDRADADTFLYYIIEKHNLATRDYPVIKRIKKKETNLSIVDQIQANEDQVVDDSPDVVVISYRISIFKHSWVILIIYTIVSYIAQWLSVNQDLRRDKVLAKGFRQYTVGLLFLFNIWVLTIGIGLETGMAESAFDFMLNKGKPIVLISNVYLIIFLFLSNKWIFMQNGAEILARMKKYPGGIFNPLKNPDSIRLVWIILTIMGLIYIFARLFI